MQIFQPEGFIWLHVQSILLDIQKKYFFWLITVQHVDSLFTNELFDTFATLADLAHDITAMDCWAQNSSTHVFVVVSF